MIPVKLDPAISGRAAPTLWRTVQKTIRRPPPPHSAPRLNQDAEAVTQMLRVRQGLELPYA